MDLANKAKQLNINSVKGNIANNLGEKGKEVTQTYLERYFPTVELELDMLNGEQTNLEYFNISASFRSKRYNKYFFHTG